MKRVPSSRSSAAVAARGRVRQQCEAGGAVGLDRPSTTVAPKITTVRLLTHSSFAVSKAVLAAFTAQTGYKVKLVQPGDAGVMVNEAILRKDNPVADALFGVDNTFLTRALDAGIFDPYVAPGSTRCRPRCRSTRSTG